MVKGRCPLLYALFGNFAVSEYCEVENIVMTPQVKMQLVLIVVSAVGKIRSNKRTAVAKALFLVWKRYGVPNEANDALAKFGLSISSRRGAEMLEEIATEEKNRMLRGLRQSKRLKNRDKVVVLDNADLKDKTKQLTQPAVDKRQQQVHVTVAAVLTLRPGSPVDQLSDVRPVGPQSVSVLFPDRFCQIRMAAAVSLSIFRVLYRNGCLNTKLGSPPKMVHLGSLDRSSFNVIDVFRYQEGKIDDMYRLLEELDLDGCLLVGDAYTVLQLLAARELRIGRDMFRPDHEDDPHPVADGNWHSVWNLVKGELLHCHRDLLEKCVEICNLKNVRLPSDVGDCFQDIDRVEHLLFPITISRLFTFFVSTIASELGFDAVDCRDNGEINRKFSLWIIGTMNSLREGEPVYEYQHLCRAAFFMGLDLALEEAKACENQELLMDWLRYRVPIAFGGPHSQYRKLTVEVAAHLARLSPRETVLFGRSLTGNYCGGSEGGKFPDEMMEFKVKTVKQILRKTHKKEGPLVPHIAAEGRMSGVCDVFGDILPGISSSGGIKSAVPDADDVSAWAQRHQWRGMMELVPAEIAKFQTRLYDVAVHGEKVLKVLMTLHRQSQFKQ